MNYWRCEACGRANKKMKRNRNPRKLARLVVDWYTAPPDDGFSPETQALQDKARWLSETPESAWL